MTEKQIKAMNYEALKEYATEKGIEFQADIKKTELLELVLNAEEPETPSENPKEPETPSENPKEPETPKSALEIELEKRKGAALKDNAFNNELLRRQGKRVGKRTFKEELKFRINKQ